MTETGRRVRGRARITSDERGLSGVRRLPLTFGRPWTYILYMEILEFPYARLGALAAAVCLFGGCAGSARPTVVTLEPAPRAEHEVAAEALPDGVFHYVLTGQTLWRIAKTYDVPLERVVKFNSIADAAQISAGDMVWIPGATRTLDVEIVEPPAVVAGKWIWPVRGGRLISGYGSPRRTHRHGGVDIGARRGEAVLASGNGRVVYSGAGLRGYGKTIILDHGDGVQSLYAHNSALLVRRGERVQRGQSIARVGQTGNATVDHCHFELRVHDRRIDPMPWFDLARRAAR